MPSQEEIDALQELFNAIAKQKLDGVRDSDIIRSYAQEGVPEEFVRAMLVKVDEEISKARRDAELQRAGQAGLFKVGCLVVAGLCLWGFIALQSSDSNLAPINIGDINVVDSIVLTALASIGLTAVYTFFASLTD